MATDNSSGEVENPEPDATASELGSMMDFFCYVWVIEGGEVGRSSIPDEIAIDTMARVLCRTVFAAPEPSHSRGDMVRRRDLARAELP